MKFLDKHTGTVLEPKSKIVTEHYLKNPERYEKTEAKNKTKKGG